MATLMRNHLQVSPLLAARTLTSVVPFRANCAFRRPSVSVRAEGEAGASAAAITAKPPPVVTWEQDTEDIRDVFGFAGSAPERANGRAAMIAFVSFVSTEFSSKVPLATQLSNGWLLGLFFSLTITIATIMPKVVSGSPLKDLHAAATGSAVSELIVRKEGPAKTAFSVFDEGNELWAGRLAMLGLTGLAIVEAVTGDSLF